MKLRRVASATLAIGGVVVALLVSSRWPLHAARAIAPPAILERTPLRPNEVSLLFLGDTGLGDAAEATLRRNGYERALSPTLDLLRGVDVVVANEEMPITDRGRRFPLYKEYVYRARPEAAKALAWAGVDVLSLANNHITDYGDVGLADTLARAHDAGMATVGAARDEGSARRGLVLRIGDTKVGVLSYCERQFLWAVYVDNFARGDGAGAAALTDEGLRADMERLRGQVDVLVVSLHIGYNYRAPTEASLSWSRLAIDLGADLVVNHHPHVAHPLAEYRGKLIASSLGNYAFGTPGHADLDFGEMLFVYLDGRRLRRVELQPIDVQNRRVHFAPRPLAGTALDDALSRLQRDSAALGATLQRRDERLVWQAP